jgi:hypothetical protein
LLAGYALLDRLAECLIDPSAFDGVATDRFRRARRDRIGMVSLDESPVRALDRFHIRRGRHAENLPAIFHGSSLPLFREFYPLSTAAAMEFISNLMRMMAWSSAL